MSGSTVPVRDTKKAVSLAKTDNSGGKADLVYFGSDYANFIVVTGNDPHAVTAESLWWISDSGVRSGVDNTHETRTALGLTSPPSPAPWVAVRLWRRAPCSHALAYHPRAHRSPHQATRLVPHHRSGRPTTR